MPTFTAIALDRFLEPKTQNSMSKPPMPKPGIEQVPSEKKINRSHVSPALYTTPEATPIPDSPMSYTPSPYIVNHKRRGPRLMKSPSLSSTASSEEANKEGVKNDGKIAISVSDVSSVELAPGSCEDVCISTSNGRKHGENVSSNGLNVIDDATKSLPSDIERDCDVEDFFDPNDALSCGSSVELDDNIGNGRILNPRNLSFREYYDASEELAGESTLNWRNVEYELREMKTNLLMEIERRKEAEEALGHMQNQWERLAKQLSLVGLSLPTASLTDTDENTVVDAAEELCQQVFIAREVANAIGRGEARAAVELEMEFQIEAKNFEITRLCDRLHYYETMNHEMSQRNQETVERARQQRYREKRNQRWIWGSISLAVTLGSIALAWSFLPSARESISTMSSSDLPGDVSVTQEQIE